MSVKSLVGERSRLNPHSLLDRSLHVSFSLGHETALALRLTWSDRSSNEWGFSLERSPTKLFTDITAFTLGANTTLFFDTTATAKTLYYYRMRAFAGPVNSSYTSSTSVTTTADSTTLVPPAPSSL